MTKYTYEVITNKILKESDVIIREGKKMVTVMVTTEPVREIMVRENIRKIRERNKREGEWEVTQIPAYDFYHSID